MSSSLRPARDRYGAVLRGALDNQNPDLEWMQVLSPYFWAYGAAPLADGFDPLMGLLYAVSAVALTVAVIAFRRRDVAV